VRELENTVQRALVTAPGPRLEARDLRFAAFASGQAARAAGADTAGRDGLFIPTGSTMADVEERLIRDALRRSRGDKERAARELGISARTLYRRASRDAADGHGEADEADD
jgi:DNA-binding NtrC family response regulator